MKKVTGLQGQVHIMQCKEQQILNCKRTKQPAPTDFLVFIFEDIYIFIWFRLAFHIMCFSANYPYGLRNSGWLWMMATEKKRAVKLLLFHLRTQIPQYNFLSFTERILHNRSGISWHLRKAQSQFVICAQKITSLHSCICFGSAGKSLSFVKRILYQVVKVCKKVRWCTVPISTFSFFCFIIYHLCYWHILRQV